MSDTGNTGQEADVTSSPAPQRGIRSNKNRDGTFTIAVETQTFDESAGRMHIETHGQITATRDEWDTIVTDVLGILVAPVTDPEVIGQYVEQVIRHRQQAS